MQNKAFRIILNAHPLTPRINIYKTLNLHTVQDRIKFQLGCLAYRSDNCLAPEHLAQHLARLPNRSMCTRSANQGNFVTPLPKTETFRDSFIYKAPMYLNSLPSEIRNSPSLSLFKTWLKKYLTPKAKTIRNRP